jgi:tetratricopeptide (TPR) repeat protein
MELVYQGKTQDAAAYLAGIPDVNREEPFYLLVKARVARELLPVDDDNKDRLEAASRPVHRDLDLVIDRCTRRMNSESPDSDPRLLLYRGLAWMSKSHLHSFARSFWSAGRNAKKGKSDLGRYLEEHPDDPLALGTMGVFLYFADTIPTLVKYLSRLLLLPGGDREKGLEYLHRAAAMESIYQVDFQVVETSIDLLFEGRFEDGLDGSKALFNRFPDYPRLCIPMALMLPFDPVGLPANTRIVDESLDRYATGATNTPEPASYPAALLDFLDAHAGRFIAPPDVAADRLNRFTEPDTGRPDWITGYAAFELGRLAASEGRSTDAGELFSFVRHHPKAALIHGEADKMHKALGRHPDAGADEYPVTEIYFGTREERTALLEQQYVVFPATTKGLFYRGETLLLNGVFGEALEVFAELVETEATPWDEEFQLLAACRAAEICGAGGDYDRAARWLERAGDYYHKEYLVDWLLEARRGYYKRLANGEEKVAPRLLAPAR